MKTSETGIELIKHYEGLHDGDLTQIGLQPKMCPAGIWTIGYGHALTNKNTGKWLKGDEDFHFIKEQYPAFLTINEQDAMMLLATDLVKFENIVSRRITVDLEQHQLDALVSHTYNTGGSDTLFKLINEGSDVKVWWTTKYTTASGVVQKGLVKRRQTEYDLFETGELKFIC